MENPHNNRNIYSESRRFGMVFDKAVINLLFGGFRGGNYEKRIESEFVCGRELNPFGWLRRVVRKPISFGDGFC